MKKLLAIITIVFLSGCDGFRIDVPSKVIENASVYCEHNSGVKSFIVTRSPTTRYTVREVVCNNNAVFFFDDQELYQEN